ncbi:hypothetical protein ACS0TY_024497 [Phlomoides rotata]
MYPFQFSRYTPLLVPFPLSPCPAPTLSLSHPLIYETSKIVEKNNKTCKRKEDLRKIVTKGLITLGYNASVCKSKWEKSSSIPAGDYEYIDVIMEGERVLIDVDFRSEFEIARSTSSYRTFLQCLPYIFVGKPNRLLLIISIMSEAARQSLKKKGMHIFGEHTTKGEEPRSLVKYSPSAMTWQLPTIKPKSLEKGNKAVVTGLASLLKEKL